MASSWRTWASDRFGIAPFKQAALDRRVAKVPWYYGDGATLTLLFGIQILTGVIMALSYSPSTDTAYESVRYITEVVPAGWFLRSLHYWSAGLMVVVLFLHVFRQILIGGYKFPREGTWLIGVFLFFGVLTMSFTGYVLRWDEVAVHALRVVLHMFSNVPWIGESLVLLVQGGDEPGSLTLTRFYAIHVVLLPMILMFLVGWHLYLVLLHGVTSHRERREPVRSAEEQKRLYDEQAESEELGETFYPYTAARSGAVAAGVFIIIVALAVFAGPAELSPEANLVEPAFPAEEWWFWWYSALIALMPPAAAPIFAVAFPILLFLVLVTLPFLDRGPFRGIRNRPIAAVVVLLALASLLALSALRLQSPWTGWPSDDLPPVPTGFTLSPTAEEGRVLFARFGCNTCHAVSGVGRLVGPDLAEISVRSQDEIRDFIQAPPQNVAMPNYERHVYEGRMTEEELQRIVEFVHVAQAFPPN